MACSDARTACTVLWPLLTRDEKTIATPRTARKIPLAVTAARGPIQCLCLPVSPCFRYFLFTLDMIFLSVTLIGRRILYIKAKG